MIDLTFSDRSKPTFTKPRSNPVELFRAALQQQIKAAQAAQDGTALNKPQKRFRDGQYIEEKRPVRVWWWADDGLFYITLRYSSQPVRIRGHQSIKCESLAKVETALQIVIDALNNGDTDVLEALEDAYQRTRWSKISKTPPDTRAANH
ncbi:hypothetical protein GCM10011332_30670 [Terasakiella brassicae]|uniref:Uncharacterized protein n=1 Tax=Terasakiella brassicae TaxID=1634917 RepID=A0A917C6G2_9PROT|nr:hypothetical protein [Terasakiella brassicae]GGF74410.1 hypothetical protein GCM10011332_30670 [Terasakiella brassicae]